MCGEYFGRSGSAGVARILSIGVPKYLAGSSTLLTPFSSARNTVALPKFRLFRNFCGCWSLKIGQRMRIVEVKDEIVMLVIVVRSTCLSVMHTHWFVWSFGNIDMILVFFRIFINLPLEKTILQRCAQQAIHFYSRKSAWNNKNWLQSPFRSANIFHNRICYCSNVIKLIVTCSH